MTAIKQKLFLLDALALIYRAHFSFSKNPRINSKGINTGATLGFTNTLVEVINKEKPTHLAVAFDRAAPTHRHQRYAAYKQHRQAQPEDITLAIPCIQDILKAFRIPILSLDGYEADDIIGTLAYQGAKEGMDVYMMTPDKDFAQLVSDHIYLYKPAFMGNSATVLDKAAILENWGISYIDQVRDILGLQGDAVDNIPGIPGIGPKTAQKLIQEFGTLEKVIAHAHTLKGKLREQVLQYSEQAILSKELATIHTNVPIQLDFAQSKYQGPDREQLKAIFQELEFRTLASRVLGETLPYASKKTVGNELSLPNPALAIDPVVSSKSLANIYTTSHQYHLIDTPALRKELIDYLQLQDTFCLDTEATSLNPYQARLLGLALAYYPGEAYYIPMPADYEETKAIVLEFKALFEHPNICKVGQNIKYDSLILHRYGIQLSQPLFDTMVAHYLVEPDLAHNLQALAESYLHYTPLPIETLIGPKGANQKNMAAVDLASIKEYACEDADITLQLKNRLEQTIQQQNLHKLLYEVELPLVRVLTAMEYQGVQIDTQALSKISQQLANDLHNLEHTIYTLANCTFNIDSPKQLGEVLFDQLKISAKPKKTKSGQYATNEQVLAEFTRKHPIVAKILAYRELQKLKSTYVDALPSLISSLDGRLHTSYNQTIVSTGRLSSTHPNLQNIPIRTEKGRAIRQAFIPSKPDHCLLSADYSQMELRIMAAFAADKTMLEAFHAEQDIHTATASKLFKVPLEAVDVAMRRQAKTANFGIIYGISAFGLATRLGISKTEAANIIDAYFKEFPGIKTYMDQIISQARNQGYVTTLLGRKRHLRAINSRNATLRGFDERNAINAPIQGTAAEMIKLAMVRIYDWLQKEKLQTKLIMQVHDELVFDMPITEVAQVKEQIPILMREALPLSVPMKVEIGIGKNWLEAH
jgi:DNA polymerase-1